MIKQTQSQRMVQKAVPLIVQKQNLLMLTNLALENMLKQELEQNPFLEEIDEIQEETQTSESDELSKDTDAEGADEAVTESKEDEFDFEDFIDDDLEGYKTDSGSSGEDARNFIFENLYSTSGTLHDNLITQLYLLHLTEKQYFIGDSIIDSIDDEGYIRMGINELTDVVNNSKKDSAFEEETFEEKEVTEVWNLVKSFDPPGIAAENLQECLIRQVLVNETTDPKLRDITIVILKKYMEELRLRHYEKLMKDMNIDNHKINQVFELISKLNPKPGLNVEVAPTEYINPDFIVYNDKGTFRAELTDKNLPNLRLNTSYVKMLRKGNSKLKKDTKDFIKNNFEKAKWFMDAIRSRKDTMMNVMNVILDRQKEFFRTNGNHIEPMFEKDIAEKIGVDISTISRTVNGKYMQTDFGIYELKSFFSNSMRSEEGQDVSTKEIKNKLVEIVQSENPANPCTDEELVDELLKSGFKLSRRTVTKYREAMKIPKARLRRKI